MRVFLFLFFVLLLFSFIIINIGDAVTVSGYLVFEVYNPNQYTISDYQARLVLTNAYGFDPSVLKPDASDLFVTDYYGKPVYYWIEKFDNASLVLWVSTGEIPALSSKKFIVYYGGDNPYTQYNDPSGVFPFFHDFALSSIGSDFVVTNVLFFNNSNGFTNITTTASSYGYAVSSSGSSTPIRLLVSLCGGNDYYTGIIDETELTADGIYNSVFLHKLNDAFFIESDYFDENNVRTNTSIASYSGDAELIFLDYVDMHVRLWVNGTMVLDKSITEPSLPSYLKGFFGFKNTTNNGFLCLKWFALGNTWFYEPRTKFLPGESLQVGTITVSPIDIVKTVTPPSPVKPPSQAFRFTEKASLGQKIIFSMIPFLITIILVLRGTNIFTSLAIGGVITMILGFILGELGFVGYGGVLFALSITLSFILR